MRKPTKAQKAALLTACREIAEYVVSIGGTVLDTRDNFIDATVNTAAGSLTLHIYPDGWIAGRFSDDRCALLGLGDTLNRFSLKYNLQGTTEAALANPSGYKQLAIAYIDRAVKATIQDEKIRIRSGDWTVVTKAEGDLDGQPVVVESSKGLPIIYEGSAAEWLSAPYDGPWQDKGVVKSLLTGNMRGIRDMRGSYAFSVERCT